MGELDKVAVRQMDYRGLLHLDRAEKAPAGGMTLEEETVHNAVSRYPADTIVNVCLVLEDVYDDALGPPQILADAISVLDHLDTLGMEVRFRS